MDKIALKRSRFFMLRKNEDRGKFFVLIAKLLWYLCSGKSHVGFCKDFVQNPLRELVMAIDKSQLIVPGVEHEKER